MLLRLFENSLLLEINLEKTKSQWFKKLMRRLIDDKTFWRGRPENKGPPEPKWAEEVLSGTGRAAGDTETTSHLNDGMVTYLNQTFDEVFHKIGTFDPSNKAEGNKGRYTLWIISNYCNGGIPMWEDMDVISDLLEKYDVLKNRRVFTNMADTHPQGSAVLKTNDINTIKGKGHLSDAVRMGEEWLSANEEKDMTVEWLRYKHWDDKDGIEILYPQNAHVTEQIDRFSRIGAVLRLNTVEASVDLFSKPTAWCTARPGNRYFDQYTRGEDTETEEFDWPWYADQHDLDIDDADAELDARRQWNMDYGYSEGGSPLYVIVDNVNGKYYQLHAKTGQYLDEDDADDYNAYSIPPILIRVAAENVSSASGAKGRAELYKNMGVEDGPLLKFITKFDQSKGGFADALWAEMRDRMVEIGGKELDFTLNTYVSEHGSLPYYPELIKVANRICGISSEDPNDQTSQGFNMDGVLAIILHYARKSKDFECMKGVLGKANYFTWILAAFYSDTPMWADARQAAIANLIAKPRYLGRVYSANGQNIEAALYRGRLKPAPLAMVSVFEIIKMTQPEVDAMTLAMAHQFPSEADGYFQNLLTARIGAPSQPVMKQFMTGLPADVRARIMLNINGYMQLKRIENDPTTDLTGFDDLIDLRELSQHVRAQDARQATINIGRIVSTLDPTSRLTPQLLVSFFRSPNMFKIWNSLMGYSGYVNTDSHMRHGAFCRMMSEAHYREYSKEMFNFFMSSLTKKPGGGALMARDKWPFVMFGTPEMGQYMTVENAKLLMNDAMEMFKHLEHQGAPSTYDICAYMVKGGLTRGLPNMSMEQITALIIDFMRAAYENKVLSRGDMFAAMTGIHRDSPEVAARIADALFPDGLNREGTGPRDFGSQFPPTRQQGGW